MPIPQTKLKLPQLEKVKLRHFSLFTANPDAEFPSNTGVVCLVGANGIGKSTLLSAINFALTGTVSDPSRPFESMEEYYKFTRNYPIVWTDVLTPYGTEEAPASAPLAVFGALSFWWLGEHGTPRIDTSDHVWFVNDQLALRFIEEIDFDYAAADATAVLLVGSAPGPA